MFGFDHSMWTVNQPLSTPSAGPSRAVRGRFDLFACAPDGSRIGHLTDTRDVDEIARAWSPTATGSRLVEDGHVAIVRADGAAAPKRITDEPVLKEWRPRWSLDGTRIVFTRDPGTILVVDPDGSHLAAVPFGNPATGADWGPAK